MSSVAPTMRIRRSALRTGGRLRFLRFWTARVGLVLIALIVLTAAFGPLVAPHGPADIVAPAFSPPGKGIPLGSDFLGRDVLSRVLYGGRTLILLALAATLVGYVIGLPAGVIAGYSRSRLDPLIMRTMDVLLAFPPLLFLLVVATGTKNSIPAIVVATGITSAPGLSRIVRATVLDVSERSYVEAAVARGERPAVIMRREILPNILGVLLADAGLRLTYSILLVAAVNCPRPTGR
jgi:peptide/nickel transport system permease protein